MKAIILFIPLMFYFSIDLNSQSLESQLKILFGDALSTFGKSNVSRFIGKSLTTSGNMKYNMEIIQAQNNQTLNINLPPNTYLGPNNQVLPKQGYEWANPSSSNDYSVIPSSTRNLPTLPGHNLDFIKKRYSHTPNNVKAASTLNTLFTYNWYADINGNGIADLSDFNNIKRTFYLGEPICYAFSFGARSGSARSGDEKADKLNFIIQIFDATTGKLIAKTNNSYHNIQSFPRHEGKIFYGSLGKYLPSGKYMIAVNMTTMNRKKNITTSLRDYFEVLE